MISEVSAFEFKLNLNLLPPTWSNLALGFAIREIRLYGLNRVAKFTCYNTEKEDNTFFINRLVSKATKINVFTINCTII